MKKVVLLLLALATLLVLTACGGSGFDPDARPADADDVQVKKATPEPTMSPAAPPKEVDAPQPTEKPTATSVATVTRNERHHLVIEGRHRGAAVASLTERLYLADVVVRAALVSTGDGQLNFRTIEYLKGSGSSHFTVNAETAEHNSQWDNREAVLFLTRVASTPSGDTSRRRDTDDTVTTSFSFIDSSTWPREYLEAGGKTTRKRGLPEGHTIDTRNPAWIPSTGQASSGSGGNVGRDTASDGSNSNPAFITETTAPDGSTNPAASLAEIKRIIAWLEAERDDPDYATCITASLGDERETRDWTAFTGQGPREIVMYHLGPSGSSELELHLYLSYEHYVQPDYAEQWLTGQDADLFSVTLRDRDSDPSNGYQYRLSAIRPLPAGTYTFLNYNKDPYFVPCNYHREASYVKWEVVKEAPDRMVLEALFDPQTIGSGDGYISSGDVTTGDLSNTSFSVIVGGVDVTIDSLKHENSAVIMALSPHNALAGHTFDFITGDGTTSLTLTGDAATGDSTTGTLTWAVSSQPWSSGDELMLRITEPWFGVRVDLSPREEGSRTLTDITISWADPQTCSDGYFVALYDGDTVVRTLGYPDSTTTSISNSTGMQWDSIPSLTSTARVNCMDNNWRLVGDVPLTSGLP